MDVQICKTRIMQTCPSCRHSYQDQLYSTCPSCSQEKLNCPRSAGPSCAVSLYDLSLSKQEQQQLRKFMSGGSRSSNNNSNTNGDPPLGKTNSDNYDLVKKKNENISPTASLSFILPPVSPVNYSNTVPKIGDKCVALFSSSEEDLRLIARSQELLKMSGWYHEGLSWKSAIELLMPRTVGTFLIRDSSDSKYLYSLSVQTKCGPTSIRIHYANGEFRLDADDDVAKYMPKYTCLIELIQRYIESTRRQPLKCSHENLDPVWVRCVGKIYAHIVLEKPIYPKGNFPSLKHLSRLCVNRHLVDPNFISVVPASSHVIKYLQEYPYKH